MQLPMLRRFLGLVALLASLCAGSGLRAEPVSPQSLSEDGA
ncbi:MAG: hypothetical protein RJB04_2431, partial [Verrucomicrobiota bacterium]